MPATTVTRTANVSDMVCASCEARIVKRLMAEPGVVMAEADYRNGTLRVAFDPGRVAWPRIGDILAEMHYTLSEPEAAVPGGGWKNAKRVAGAALLVLVLYEIGRRFGLFSLMNIFPEAESGMGLGMIFLIGLLTSAHCLAMCGGINLSQTALKAPRTGGGLAAAKPTLLYGAGRVVSYTAIGAAVGGLGSIIGFSSTGKGLIQIAAGVFMLIMGLALMGVFPWLRRFIPRLPQSLSGKVSGGAGRGPLYVGLLNGFMPCGPLQTMQLFALSTGSPAEGALAMFAFAVGTLPLTMGLGMAASFLGRRFAGSAVRVGAVLVFLMGLGMLGNGLTLAGFVRPALSGDGDVAASVVADGRQIVETRLRPDAYQPVRVRAGVPVVWRITVEPGALNGCNNRFFIPAFNVERRLVPGENVIEFTPDKPGVHPYMCWMGMIASRIVVGDVEDSGATPEYDASVLPPSDAEDDEDIPWL